MKHPRPLTNEQFDQMRSGDEFQAWLDEGIRALQPKTSRSPIGLTAEEIEAKTPEEWDAEIFAWRGYRL